MMLATSIEQSLFRSVESALAFAFSEQYVDLPQSPASRMASTPSRSGNGLGGLDGFAQAGMILSSMGDLSELHRNILTARFSPATQACACGRNCCRGFTDKPRWLLAVAWVSEFIGEQYAPVLPYLLLREGIVRRHFGDKKTGLGIIADRVGIHKNTMSKYNSAVLTILRVHEKQARFEIRAVLESSGLVGN